MVLSFDPESTTTISSAHLTLSRVRGRLASSFIAIMATDRVLRICPQDKSLKAGFRDRGSAGSPHLRAPDRRWGRPRPPRLGWQRRSPHPRDTLKISTGVDMAAGIQLPGNDETIDLQQQVFRLQALLEASRQVHSTIREEEVLESVLRIVVRELEMAGAAFPGTGFAYGAPINSIPVTDPVNKAAANPTYDSTIVPPFPLTDRDGKRMTELVVATPDDRPLTIYEADFL